MPGQSWRLNKSEPNFDLPSVESVPNQFYTNIHTMWPKRQNISLNDTTNNNGKKEKERKIKEIKT